MFKRCLKKNSYIKLEFHYGSEKLVKNLIDNDFLVDALQNYFEIRIFEQNDNSPDQSEHLVIVLENYTLPGMDFDNSQDQTVLEWAKNFSPHNVTVIALRDSFNLPETEPFTTLCTYSFRQESAIAAANCQDAEELRGDRGGFCHSAHIQGVLSLIHI